MVKVSVIMPVFNGVNFLDTSCQSLYNQTLNDIELICVNDGSTDNTLDKLHELSKKYDFIKIFNQENQGSGKARNNGIKEATGEYIAFLDADDIFVDENALELMYKYGTENNADMVGGNLKRVADDGTLEDNFNYKHKNYTYFDKYGFILPEDYGIPWAFYKNIFKKELLYENKILFPDLKRGQDPVFLAEILTKISKIYTVPIDLYGYNYSNNGGANAKINSYEKKSRLF
ncbi:glycosyltransferase family 2 protein [Methanosphaera sp. WGK6]|uniref:glycosyltransferase family 2 protein n=1 Tax=Methanosphaera sp. WGK6 TaxID=1561964 RepID=UPI00084BCF23|nr:glycosyltransferase family 2 protein [Methanosphaera sp. WGK6]